MTRRFTKRNEKGIKTKSTLLTAIKKMESLHKQAKTNHRLRQQNDSEGTLNKMAMWLVAVTKCPPRHYGKVWNKEKELIVEQCQAMYLDAQKYQSKKGDAFMGHITKSGSQDGDSRFMPIYRLRWNVASAKWDFTNKPTVGKNPYWNEKANVPSKVRRITDPVEVAAALKQHEKDMVPKLVTYGPKVTQPYASFRASYDASLKEKRWI